MSYSVGDKVDLKDVDLFVEIISKYPGSQGMRLNIVGEDYFGVYINGSKCYIGESLLNLFAQNISEKKAKIELPVVVEKPVILEPFSVNEPIIEIKKRGRPKKGEN